METLTIGNFEFIANQWPMDTDKETLLLIHGASMSCHFWESQVTGLSPHANVISINLPGRGHLDTEVCDSIQENADHVLQFIHGNQIKNPIICGHSMGGAVVLSLLINKNNNNKTIKAGVVVNSGARLRVSRMILDAIAKDYNSFVQLMEQFTFPRKNDTKKIRTLFNRSVTDNAKTALKDFQACNVFNVINDLGTISAPVLVLTASKDLLTPVKYGEHLKSAIHNARLCCIKDAGHISPMEAPETVNKEILKFMKNLLKFDDLAPIK